MGLFFNRDSMSKEAGEWAAIAMACMCYADGEATDEELRIARRQAASNPVIRKSIGAKRSNELFEKTIQAIFEVPSAMLASYEVSLQELAAEIDEVDEKNFALTTVIAVALGDRAVSEREHAMLTRFKESLKATVEVPDIGSVVAPVLRQAAQQAPANPGDVVDERIVTCRECGKLTSFFEKYGYWCASCELYTEVAGATDALAALNPGAPVEAETAPKAMVCKTCGQPVTYYEGYGFWCTPCQSYTVEGP